MKPIVYTAIYGGYDNPKDQPDIGVDYICYTDNPDLKSNTWQVRYEPIFPKLHPRMRAKYWKLVCPFDSLSLWIDGSIEIVDRNIIDRLSKYLDNGWATYKHPSPRDCIKEELEASLPMEKYRDVPVKEQVEYYFAQGMPEHFGLWACGVMLRDGRFEDFGNKWFIENLAWTYQDQISLPYLVWKEKFPIDTIELDQYSGELFKIHGHNRDD